MGAEEAVPLARLSVQMIFQKYGVRWFVWFFTKLHARFLRCIVTLFSVAFFACSYQVHPAVGAAFCSRHYVVDRQVASRPAILAFKVVAFKYILPGKINALVGGVYISIQPYNRRHRETLGYGMQAVAVSGPDQFTLF